MKKFRTDSIRKSNIDLAQVRDIVFHLRDAEDEHLWIVLSDTSKKNPNYAQATLIDEDHVKVAAEYIHKYFDIRAANEIPYLFEARFYQGDDFTHYRAYFPEPGPIVELFERYANDTLTPSETWLDVTEEFLEEDEEDED